MGLKRLKLYRILLLVFLLVGMIQFRAHAAELGDKLQLAPQSEGPSLEETSKWIKQKIDSLRGFDYWNTGGCTKQVEYTSFDIDKNYIMTIRQKQSNCPNGWGGTEERFVCDMKELSQADKYTTRVSVYFNKQCKIYKYSGDDKPFYNNGHHFDAGDSETAEKLIKAFNHAAELFKKMPKKRSDELF